MAIKAAAAVELLQDYLLIIDDVMDVSEKRRGKPSVHELYKSKKYGDYSSKMIAINIGLLAQHLSNLIISNLLIEPTAIIDSLKLLHRNIELTGLGQLDDINQSVHSVVTRKDIIRMYKLKSGYYTFVNPMQIGLVLAGDKNKALLKEIEIYGVNAGVSFQLKDDILGLFGDTAKTGKPIGDDVKEGKITLLTERCLKLANDNDANFVRSKLGNHKLSLEDINNIKKIIIKCGALSSVENEISNFATKAKDIIQKSHYWDNDTKSLLTGMVEFSAERAM